MTYRLSVLSDENISTDDFVYEPYAGETFPVALPEMVYGLPGAEDEVRSDGEVVHRTKINNLKNMYWITYGSGIGNDLYGFASSNGAVGAFQNIIRTDFAKSSHFTQRRRDSVTIDALEGIYLGAADAVYVKIRKSALVDNSVMSFMAWLNANDPVLVYQIATPQTLTIDPIKFPARSGVNNVFSDAGGETTACVTPFQYIFTLEQRIKVLEALISSL